VGRQGSPRGVYGVVDASGRARTGATMTMATEPAVLVAQLPEGSGFRTWSGRPDGDARRLPSRHHRLVALVRARVSALTALDPRDRGDPARARRCGPPHDRLPRGPFCGRRD